MTRVVAFFVFRIFYVAYYFLPFVILMLLIRYFAGYMPELLMYLFLVVFIGLLFLVELRSRNAADVYTDKLSFIEAHNDSGSYLRSLVKMSLSNIGITRDSNDTTGGDADSRRKNSGER